MAKLNESFQWLYKMFSEKGLFCVWRGTRYLGGMSTDLVIEQVLMRLVDSISRLTQGRGVTVSVKIIYINSIHQCSAVLQVMSKLTNVKRLSVKAGMRNQITE